MFYNTFISSQQLFIVFYIKLYIYIYIYLMVWDLRLGLRVTCLNITIAGDYSAIAVVLKFVGVLHC